MRRKVVALVGLILLCFSIQTVRADSSEVTFNGQIYFTFDSLFGGPSFHGIQAGDSFSSLLTYNLEQPNLGLIPNLGQYFDYQYSVTVETNDGPVTLTAPGYPLKVYNEFADGPNLFDTVNNGGSGVAFILSDFSRTALSSDALADVNWQNLLALSTLPRMFLRAPNAAVVVEGSIDRLDVTIIPSPPPPIPEPIPEPTALLLFGSGILSFAVRHSRQARKR